MNPYIRTLWLLECPVHTILNFNEVGIVNDFFQVPDVYTPIPKNLWQHISPVQALFTEQRDESALFYLQELAFKTNAEPVGSLSWLGKRFMIVFEDADGKLCLVGSDASLRFKKQKCTRNKETTTYSFHFAGVNYDPILEVDYAYFFSPKQSPEERWVQEPIDGANFPLSQYYNSQIPQD